jgi:hypothetical protein
MAVNYNMFQACNIETLWNDRKKIKKTINKIQYCVGPLDEKSPRFSVYKMFKKINSELFYVDSYHTLTTNN